MGDDGIKITKEVTYQRVPGTTAMTMVAGGQKGMFPSQQSHNYNVHKFCDIGIVEVANISTKKKIDKTPVAEITIVHADDDGS